MAKQSSFDVVSRIDLQEVDNAVNQAIKEIQTRYDLKNSKTVIEFDRKNGWIDVESASDFTLKSALDILSTKAIRRGLSAKALKQGEIVEGSMGSARVKVELVQGISKDQARVIVKHVKDAKLKAEVAIEGDKLRVSAKSKDALQEVIVRLKELDFEIPLQFVNYR